MQNEQRQILEKLRVQSALRAAQESLTNRQYAQAISQLEPFLDFAGSTPVFFPHLNPRIVAGLVNFSHRALREMPPLSRNDSALFRER